MRIVWFLERHHDIKISDATVSRILRRHEINRLPRGTRMRKVHTKRYQKRVPGHHIQMDVKFLTFNGKQGEKGRRFHYAAIDNAARVRALKVYERHTQANAIDFANHIIEKVPFRIREIRTELPMIAPLATAMNSKRNYIGTSRTLASVMPTSSAARLN